MSRPSDRNLLFGLLALQMDFISRDALIEAMQAWVLDKQKTLGELLVERGALSASRRQLLEPLVDEHVQQHGGDAQQSLAALSSDGGAAAKLEQLGDEDLQHSLQQLPPRSEFEVGARSSVSPLEGPLAHDEAPGDGAPGDGVSPDDNAALETYLQATLDQPEQPQQRFRILRPHAQGGLGRVLVALDQELHREVAFKEILPKHSHNKDSRTRFVVEAEVTGGLEHPGIVPVYGLGHYADGRPFYAMRFIKGQSLQDAVSDFFKKSKATGNSASERYENNLAFRDLINRLIDVCNAIAYAHSRKVLHRDLKPGNIMLGKYGETLVVDWGLAKAQGVSDPQSRSTDGELPIVPTSGSQSAPTMAGAVIGTPAYMSPEQAAGHLEQLGPATDVYALGATLYEVLTGAAPLKGTPIADLLRRVTAGDIPSARTLNPQVPQALDAICRKAMSKAIRDRYATAAAMAKDLEAWLADEPVSALKEPLLARARRWSRRHPALVSSVTAAVLMAAVGLSIGFVVVTGKNSELDAKNDQLDQKNSALTASLEREQTALKLSQANEARAIANEQRAIAGETQAKQNELLAETNAKAATEQSALALSTLTAVIFDIQRSLENVPGGATVRHRLLTSVLPQLDKVSTQFASQSAVDRNTMVALFELADTILQLGQSSAQAPGEEPADPDDGPPQDDPSAQSAVLTAEKLYRRAHEIAQQLAQVAPDDADAQRNLSISYERLGNVFLTLGQTDDALARYQALHASCLALAETDPRDAQKQRDLSISYERLGDVFLTLGRTDDALAQFEDGLKIRRVLAEADPRDAQKQRDLSISYERLGDVFLTLGRTDDALAQFEAKQKIDLALVASDPKHTENQRNLSISYERLGDVFLTLGRTDDALAQFEAKQKIDLALVASDPKHTENQRNLSSSYERLGDVFLKLGRTDDALAQFEAKQKIDLALVASDPKHTENQRNLSISYERLGDVFLTLGRTDDALAQFEDGLKIRRVLAEADPRDAQKQRDLSISFNKLGDVFLTLGHTDDALTQFQDGLKIRRVLTEADPNDAQKQRDLSISFDRLGDAFLKLGRTDDALAQFEDGLKIRRVLAEADPRDAQKQRDLSISFNKLGDVFLTLGHTDDALTQFQDGLKIRRVLTEADPNDAQKQRDLSISFDRLGDAFLKLGRTDDALAQFEDGLKIRRVLAEADPRDAQKQRDLSISYERLGDVFLTLGRTDDALAQFEAKQKIDLALVASDPKHTENQRNLSISYERLGDVFLKLGRTDDALTQFQDGLKISRVLAEADPHDAQKQRDLSISFNKLGDVFLKLGRTDDALTQFQADLKISRVLAEADPHSAEKQWDLMVSHYKLGEVEVQAGRFDAAREQFQTGVAVLDRMIARKQNEAASRQEKEFLQGRIQFCTAAALATGDWDALLKTDAPALPDLLSIRATELARRGQQSDVAQAGAKLRDLATAAEPGPANQQKGGMLYNAARAYGLCATLSLIDKPQPTDAEQAEHQKYLDLSLTCLKEAVAAGWDNYEHIAQDTDLTPLRELPEFQALLKQRPEKKP